MGNKAQINNAAEISGRNDVRRRQRLSAYARGFRNICRAQGCVKK